MSNVCLKQILIAIIVGANKDFVVIGSDSGKISVVEVLCVFYIHTYPRKCIHNTIQFDTKKNDWKVVHCEVFGKSGCRRIVPGQYLAADPKERAILIGKHIEDINNSREQ
jgi:splicing factor 3B subunit 3